MTSPTLASGHELSQGYELLRAQALPGAAERTSRGLALLMRSGLTAWMTVWAHLVPSSPPSPPPSPRSTSPAEPSGATSSSRWGAEVAALLADMALDAGRRALA